MINFIFIQLFGVLFLFSVASFADASSPLFFSSPPNIPSSSREQFIQKKLDCVANAVKTTDESRWEQLCSTASAASPGEKREDIITRALDSTEKGQTSQQTDNPSQGLVSPGSEFTPPAAPGQKWVGNEAGENLGVIQLKEHDVEFGTELYRYSYKEPGFNLEIKGLQFGVEGAYVYRPKEGDALRSDVLNMYKFDARFAFGPVDYHSDPSGQLKDEDNYAFEVRGIAGDDHLFNEQFLLTGYAGFGFRYLNNDSGGRQSTTGAYGYDRVSNYFYLPIGVEALNQIAPGWKIASNFEWDIFLAGEQTSYLSDVNSGYPDPENNQKRGYGVRGSLKIMKDTEHASLFLEPFFRYWRIHDSEVTTTVGNDYTVTGLEPDNNTTEYGLKLGLRY